MSTQIDTQGLRDANREVLTLSVASDYFATLVVARRDDPTAARAVARYLGKPPVLLQARSGEPEEVTVVIGSDRSRVRFEP